MFCRFCGSQLREGAKFCTQCGKQIVASNPAPTATPIPEQQPAYTAPAAPVQPAPEVQYTPEPKVQPEPATPVADPAPKYEAPAAYTAPAYTAEPSVPADKKAKKVKKEGKKSKKGLVITLIILAILAVAAAAYFIFFGNKIEISDEAIAAIYEDTGIENAEDVIKIVSAKVMSTETATLMGVDMKDEHVRLKAETEFAEVEFCYVISYSNYSGEWHVEYVKEYYGEDCGHGGNVVHVKKVLTKEQVEADIREYFEDADMVCTNVVIPENPKNAIEGIDVTLTVNGEIYGSIMWANVTVHYQPDATKGWGIRYANYEEIDAPANNGGSGDAAVEQLPSATPDETPSTPGIDRVPDPDQPVSDEKVIEDLSSYNDFSSVEILKSGYNYDGTYIFICLATSNEYAPFSSVKRLYECRYTYDENYSNDWRISSTTSSHCSIDAAHKLLGAWDGSKGDEKYTLSVTDISFEITDEGDTNATVTFNFNYNGKTIQGERNCSLYSRGDYLFFNINSDYSNDEPFGLLSFRIYENGAEGENGWYVNEETLLSLIPGTEPHTSTYDGQLHVNLKTTMPAPYPSQPVSDETVINTLLGYSNSYYTDAKVLKSGYNIDGTYTFLMFLTSNEFSPYIFNYLYEKEYYYDERYQKWDSNGGSYSIYGVETVDKFLGTWKGSQDGKTYTLNVYDMGFEAESLTSVKNTIMFTLDYNGKTIKGERNMYFSFMTYNSLALKVSTYSDDIGNDVLEFRVYADVAEGTNGWYVDGVLLTKANSTETTQTNTATQIKASDLVGRWSYLSPSTDEIYETILKLDNYGNFIDISYPYAWINEDGEGEVAKGPIEGIEGTYSISKTADNSTNLILYRPAGIDRYDEYYPEYTRTYQIIDFSPKSRLTIKNLENGKTYTYYYSGNETSGYLNIPELAEKQGIDVPPELYIPIYERFN